MEIEPNTALSIVGLILSQVVAVVGMATRRLFLKIDKIIDHLAILNGRTTKVETLVDVASTALKNKEVRDEWFTKKLTDLKETK